MTEYVRNCWYAAAWNHEVTDAPLGRTFLDEPVVLYRKDDGAVVALEDRCCHRSLPLSMGRVEGDVWRWTPASASLPQAATTMRIIVTATSTVTPMMIPA